MRKNLLKRIGFIFIGLLLLAGCANTVPVVKKSQHVKDSVVTQIKYVPRDTIVVVPKDSMNVKVSLEDLGINPYTEVSKSGEIQATIQRIEDTIIVDCQVEELQLKLELLDKKIKTLKMREVVNTERVEVPKRYVPWWVKLLAWAGGIAIVWLALKKTIKSLNPF